MSEKMGRISQVFHVNFAIIFLFVLGFLKESERYFSDFMDNGPISYLFYPLFADFHIFSPSIGSFNFNSPNYDPFQ